MILQLTTAVGRGKELRGIFARGSIVTCISNASYGDGACARGRCAIGIEILDPLDQGLHIIH